MNFRRMITVFAVLALFAGLASAQIQNQVMQCNATGAVPPVLRAEGITELTGDIIITCTGGAAIPQIGGVPGPGAAGFANFQVSLPTNVTSRQNEPLLMIDEPGSGLTGSPATQVAAPTTPPAAPQNIFPGTVAGNQVFFNAIPIVAPFTQGFTRVYRIVNIRANATTLPSGAFAGTSPVFAYVAISGSQSLSLPFSQLTVGYVAPGLGTSSGGTPISFLQCESKTTFAAGTITFKELFATAFKPRSVGNDLIPFSPTTTPDQNSPGKIYNTESGFYYASGGSTVGSVAGTGTRLRATFNNVPSGVRVFVGTGATQNSVVLAQLVTSDSAVYSAPSAPTQEVTITNGTGSVYYEWVAPTSYANTIDTVTFPVTITYTGNQSANTPTAGQVATVSVSFAPISSVFTSSSTAPIPRFVDLGLAPTNLFVFNPCQTTLLFPFVTNQGGFDTGLAISNTSTDPFVGTPKQAGACTLYFYSGGTAVPNFVTASIGTGTTYVNLASAVAANFQGYMIAVCNFQYAHGFAFISDIGAREIAMGYLALVLQSPNAALTRAVPVAEQLNN